MVISAAARAAAKIARAAALRKTRVVKKTTTSKTKRRKPKYQNKKYIKTHVTKAQANKIKRAQVALKQRQEGLDGGSLIFGFVGMGAGRKVTGVRKPVVLTKKLIAERRLSRKNRMRDEANKKAISDRKADITRRFWGREPEIMKSLTPQEVNALHKARVTQGFQTTVIRFRGSDGTVPIQGEFFPGGDSSIVNIKTFGSQPNPFYGFGTWPKKGMTPKSHRPKLSKLEFEDLKMRYIAFKKIGVLKRVGRK